MSAMNVNQISNANAWANVDSNSLVQVTNEILSRNSQPKTIDLNNVDLSKFNRANRGVDLYNPNTSIDTQRQVSMTNAGLLDVSNVNTAFLNSMAASSLYSENVANNVQGKMTINIQEGELQMLKEVQLPTSMTEVFSTAELAKDRRGSNPFAYMKSSPDEKDGLDITA